MFRKIAVFIAGATLVFVLLLGVVGYSATSTFTAKNLKLWLSKSGIYDTFVDDILQASTKSLSDNQSAAQSAIDQPGVKIAAKKAFSPTFLQDATEQIINGTDSWLAGKTQVPEFKIEIGKAKAQFADALGVYALKRYTALPACKPGQIPKTTDILSIECRVPGLNISPKVAKQVSDLKNSDSFLPNQVVTADSITAGGDKTPVYQQAHNLPALYRFARITPYIFGFFALIGIAIIVFLSSDIRKGLRRVLVSLSLTAGLLIFSVWTTSILFRIANDKIGKNSNGSYHNVQTAVFYVANQAEMSLNRWQLIFGCIFALAAIGIGTYLFLSRAKEPEIAKTDNKQPSTATEDKTTKPKKT